MLADFGFVGALRSRWFDLATLSLDMALKGYATGKLVQVSNSMWMACAFFWRPTLSLLLELYRISSDDDYSVLVFPGPAFDELHLLSLL